MKNRRPEIVGDEIQKIVSTIISTKLKDPRVPLLTSVTSVKMSRDLSHATVFISVYGDEKTQKEAMEAIEHAKGFIRYETVQEITLLPGHPHACLLFLLWQCVLLHLP